MSAPRGVLIAGNWKMNHTRAQTRGFFSDIQKQWSGLSAGCKRALESRSLQATLFPPMLSLEAALEARKSLPISVGCQNVHWEDQGAFTGEISASMLKEIGVDWALTGHSERRQFFGETNATVLKRSDFLLRKKFQVILCVGETQAERQSGQTEAVLLRQVAEAVPNNGQFLNGQLVIAYEPVWAIGTGLNATSVQAEEAHQLIRKTLWDRFGMEASGKTPILYGGSVSPNNIAELLSCPNVDGALVGGASLKAESFIALVEAGAEKINT